MDTAVLLVVDSGASATVFDKATLESCGAFDEMQIDSDMTLGIGQEPVNGVTASRIERFALGELEINEFIGGVLDFTHINDMYERMGLPHIAGILGCDILVEYKATLDFAAETLTLNEPDTKGEHIGTFDTADLA